MPSRAKAEQLNIRTTALQKMKLAEAARLSNMNVSQFVLSKSLDAAEEMIANQQRLHLNAGDSEWFAAKLEEPPQLLMKLRELFNEPSVFET